MVLFFFITLKPRVERYTKSMSLKCEPASDPLHIGTLVMRDDMVQGAGCRVQGAGCRVQGVCAIRKMHVQRAFATDPRQCVGLGFRVCVTPC